MEMEKWEIELLKECHEDVLNSLEPNDIIHYMLYHGFSDEDLAAVEGTKSRSGRVTTFVNILKRKSTMKAFIKPLWDKEYKALVRKFVANGLPACYLEELDPGAVHIANGIGNGNSSGQLQIPTAAGSDNGNRASTSQNSDTIQDHKELQQQLQTQPHEESTVQNENTLHIQHQQAREALQPLIAPTNLQVSQRQETAQELHRLDNFPQNLPVGAHQEEEEAEGGVPQEAHPMLNQRMWNQSLESPEGSRRSCIRRSRSRSRRIIKRFWQTVRNYPKCSAFVTAVIFLILGITLWRIIRATLPQKPKNQHQKGLDNNGSDFATMNTTTDRPSTYTSWTAHNITSLLTAVSSDTNVITSHGSDLIDELKPKNDVMIFGMQWNENDAKLNNEKFGTDRKLIDGIRVQFEMPIRHCYLTSNENGSLNFSSRSDRGFLQLDVSGKFHVSITMTIRRGVSPNQQGIPPAVTVTLYKSPQGTESVCEGCDIAACQTRFLFEPCEIRINTLSILQSQLGTQLIPVPSQEVDILGYTAYVKYIGP